MIFNWFKPLNIINIYHNLCHFPTKKSSFKHTDPNNKEKQGISSTLSPSQLSRLSPFCPSVCFSSSPSHHPSINISTKLPSKKSVVPHADHPHLFLPRPPAPPRKLRYSHMHAHPRVLAKPQSYLLIVRQLQPFSLHLSWQLLDSWRNKLMSGGVTGRGRSHLEISKLRSSDFLVVLRPSSHISTRLVRSLVCGIERAGTQVSCSSKGTFLHIKPRKAFGEPLWHYLEAEIVSY